MALATDEEVRERRAGTHFRPQATGPRPGEAARIEHPLLEARHPPNRRGIGEIRRFDTDLELPGNARNVLHPVEISNRPRALGGKITNIRRGPNLSAKPPADHSKPPADRKHPPRMA